MEINTSTILVLNGGSSSIKFSVYEIEGLQCLVQGEVESIGSRNVTLGFQDVLTGKRDSISYNPAGYATAADFLLFWLEEQKYFNSIKVAGHRIVYGMHYTEPAVITPEMMKELKRFSEYAPAHLPHELKLIELLEKHHPELIQVACFDTAFHADLPPVAKRLPIPRRFYERGIYRYGFHGISYAYLMEELTRLEGSKTTQGKLVLLHLGNGASIAAVKEGKCIDTSMAFTPGGGFPMSTRSGDLDPGVIIGLMRTEGLDEKGLANMLMKESGLLGISECTGNMRELIELQHTDYKAAEAIALFCYQVKKWIGAYAAAMGGIDTLVFTGGVGENAPEIRERICAGLHFLGIELDESKNLRSESVISSTGSQVPVRVIRTNEEWMIAQSAGEILKSSLKQ